MRYMKQTGARVSASFIGLTRLSKAVRSFPGQECLFSLQCQTLNTQTHTLGLLRGPAFLGVDFGKRYSGKQWWERQVSM